MKLKSIGLILGSVLIVVILVVLFMYYNGGLFTPTSGIQTIRDISAFSIRLDDNALLPDINDTLNKSSMYFIDRKTCLDAYNEA